jgi:hypothetical protein
MIFDLKSFWNIYLYFIKNDYFFNYNISFSNLKYLILLHSLNIIYINQKN